VSFPRKRESREPPRSRDGDRPYWIPAFAGTAIARQATSGASHPRARLLARRR
jgi:hypothetical protein